jgi:5-methylcytosine-specific restriction enzyme A
MKYWLFQIMYDSYPKSWDAMIKMGVAAQHYPLSRNWVGAQRNNNALKKLRSGDMIVAAFKDHRFAGYGKLSSDFHIGGPSLGIPHLGNGGLMEFHERFDCDWTVIPPDEKRPFINCSGLKKQGLNIDMARGSCVKQIDKNTFSALKSKLVKSGAKRIFPLFEENNDKDLDIQAKENETCERQYWLWVTRPEYYDSVEACDGWSCHEDTKMGDLVLLWRAKGKSDIGHLLQVESDAVPNKKWKYSCGYKTLYTFNNPINIKDIRADPYFEGWPPLKMNFQRKAFDIQENHWNRLTQIAIKKDPKYKEIIKLFVPNDTKTDFNVSDYASAFRVLQLDLRHQEMLLSHYYAPDRTLSATQMAKAMGYDHFSAANLHYGTLGGIVGEKLGWNPLPEFKVNVLVDFEKTDGEWTWIMKPVVAEAIKLLGWAEEQPTMPEEVVQIEPIYEGAMRKISVNAYERSTAARKACLLHYGCKCTVCDRILSDIYGEIAQGHIHVHHLRPLSEINSEYQIDPVTDLRPVCPTCHSIIHLKTPPYSIEEVREAMKQQVH